VQRIIICIIAYVLLFGSTASASEKEKVVPKDLDAQQMEELAAKSGVDPTRQRDKMAIVYERNNYPHDTYFYLPPGSIVPRRWPSNPALSRWIARGGYTIKKGPAEGLYLQLDAPFQTTFSGIPFEGATGFGDLKFTFLYTWGKPELKFAFASENTFNTAEKKQLGGGTTTLGPAFAVSKRVARPMFAIAALQYSFDVQRDSDVAYTNQLALRLFALNFWPKLFFTVIEVRPAYDFRTNHTTILFAPQIGKILGKHFSVALYTQQPLDSWTRNRMGTQYKATITYNF
jgi:hypothetical protein